MNVIYDRKDAARAARIRKKEQEMAAERERKRQIELNRKDFNLKIREPGGKLSMGDLKGINSVYKRDYISMVVEEDDQIRGHIGKVERKV